MPTVQVSDKEKIVKADILQALILTKDEEPNIGRVLERLDWLERVVVLDSNSSDSTVEIVKSFPNVSLHNRTFDSHAAQWNHGLSLLKSDWVLSLDADYVLPDEFVAEVREKITLTDISAFYTSFRFVVFGKKLTNDNTTPRPVLFKLDECTYYNDGHTQRLAINGKTGEFKNYLLHDDRKSLSRWLSNQGMYSIRECSKLVEAKDESLSLPSRLRKNKVLAPVIVFIYCIFVRGLIFNGWRGWHYILQRTMVEMLLSLRLIEETELKNRS